jgi:hypothetical protein
MPADLSTSKVTKGEQPSSAKFNAFVQGLQDDVNAIGNTTKMGFTLGSWLDPAKLKQGGAAATDILAWSGAAWAPAAAPAVSAFSLISDQTLGAGAASIVFSSIAGTFKHLRLWGYLRCDAAANNDHLLVRLNGDNGANYDSYDVRIISVTPSVAADEQIANTSMRFDSCVPGATAPANLFSSVEILVPHYAGTTNNKTISAEPRT